VPVSLLEIAIGDFQLEPYGKPEKLYYNTYVVRKETVLCFSYVVFTLVLVSRPGS